MIRAIREPMFRMKPILKEVDGTDGIEIEKSYRLQRKITIGPFHYWVDQRSTGLIHVEGSAHKLENFVSHLTQTIYLTEETA